MKEESKLASYVFLDQDLEHFFFFFLFLCSQLNDGETDGVAFTLASTFISFEDDDYLGFPTVELSVKEIYQVKINSGQGDQISPVWTPKSPASFLRRPVRFLLSYILPLRRRFLLLLTDCFVCFFSLKWPKGRLSGSAAPPTALTIPIPRAQAAGMWPVRGLPRRRRRRRLIPGRYASHSQAHSRPILRPILAYQPPGDVSIKNQPPPPPLLL